MSKRLATEFSDSITILITDPVAKLVQLKVSPIMIPGFILQQHCFCVSVAGNGGAISRISHSRDGCVASVWIRLPAFAARFEFEGCGFRDTHDWHGTGGILGDFPRRSVGGCWSVSE